MSVVKYECNAGVCTLTLNRPDALNAFSPDLMSDLCQAFLYATSDDSARVVVLTGAGRAFSAGADLKSMAGGNNQEPPEYDFKSMLDAIIDFPKPFIVAANGLGVGIGMTILGLADLAFVAESSRFRTPFSSLGLTAEAASTYSFSRLMGHQKAAWVLMSGEWVTGSECVELGLATEVIADSDLMESVNEKAATLARLPLASLIETKALMMEPHRQAMKDAIKRENAGLAKLAGGPANKEAIAAFMEKREPDFG